MQKTNGHRALGDYVRLTWRHLKSDGTAYEMRGDFCPTHAAKISRPIIERLPAPMVQGKERCVGCGTAQVSHRRLGRAPFDTPYREWGRRMRGTVIEGRG